MGLRRAKPAAACAAVALSLISAASGADVASASNLPRSGKDKSADRHHKVSVDTASATLFAHVHPIQSVQNALHAQSPAKPLSLAGSILAGGVLMQQAFAHKEFLEGFLGKKRGKFLESKQREVTPAPAAAPQTEAAPEKNVEHGPLNTPAPVQQPTQSPWRIMLAAFLATAALVAGTVRRARTSAKRSVEQACGTGQNARLVAVDKAILPDGPSMTPLRSPRTSTGSLQSASSENELHLAAQKALERSKNGSLVWQSVSEIEMKVAAGGRDDDDVSTPPRSFSRRTTGQCPTTARSNPSNTEFHRLMTESAAVDDVAKGRGAGIESLYDSMSCEFHRLITPGCQEGLVRQRTQDIEKTCPDVPGVFLPQRSVSAGYEAFWKSEANEAPAEKVEENPQNLLDNHLLQELHSSPIVGS